MPVVLRGGFTKARERGTAVTHAARPLHDRYFRYTTVIKVSVGSASLMRGRGACAHARACWVWWVVCIVGAGREAATVMAVVAPRAALVTGVGVVQELAGVLVWVDFVRT